MRKTILRSAGAIAALALVGAGIVAGTGAANAASPTCYQSTPTAPSTQVKGFDIFESTGANIDFAAARSKGACFVYIKASGGLSVTNDNFDAQWSGARAAGLLTGTYHLAAPNLGSGADEANWFLTHDGQWSADGKTLPPALDLEVNDQQTSVNACYSKTPAALRSWILDFSATVQAATTRKPVIYTSKGFWSQCLANSTALRSNLLWVTSPGTPTPSMPAAWTSYAFWQKSFNTNGTDPFPGDQDTFHGTVAQLTALANPSAAHDYTGDGLPDVLSLSAGGTLHGDIGAGDGTLTGALTATGAAISGSWRIIAGGDVNGDGIADVYAIDPSGVVFLYLGKAGGGLSASARAVARGWGGLHTVANVGDFNGDGRPDLLARTSSGQLWLYPAIHGGFATHQVVGNGFQTMTAIVGAGDLTGDGQPDLLTRTSTGQLWIYPHTNAGLGTHIAGPSGFASANSIFSVGDFTGDTHDDILVRQGGVLKVYAGDGHGHLAAGVTVTAPAEVGTSTFVG